MSQLNCTINADQILDSVYCSVRVVNYSIAPEWVGHTWEFTDSFALIDYGSNKEWLSALLIGIAESL